jgi:predicted regulator of Ras-like GTPase activity (Roadblock/LC7/MglB family)
MGKLPSLSIFFPFWNEEKNIESKLKEYLFLLKAECVFIADNKGRVLSSKVEHDEFSKLSLASCALNALHSLRSFLEVLGGNKGESLLFTGEDQSSYFIALSPKTLLGVIFREEIPFGFIKLKVRNLLQELQTMTKTDIHKENQLFLSRADEDKVLEKTKEH